MRSRLDWQGRKKLTFCGGLTYEKSKDCEDKKIILPRRWRENEKYSLIKALLPFMLCSEPNVQECDATGDARPRPYRHGRAYRTLGS